MFFLGCSFLVFCCFLVCKFSWLGNCRSVFCLVFLGCGRFWCIVLGW